MAQCVTPVLRVIAVTVFQLPQDVLGVGLCVEVRAIPVVRRAMDRVRQHARHVHLDLHSTLEGAQQQIKHTCRTIAVVPRTGRITMTAESVSQ